VIHKALAGTLEMHSGVAMKARHGKSKPFLEQDAGDSFHRNTGKWTTLQRVIDRAGNWYSETVTDPGTGETIHKCEEPLDQHRGHGAAKVQK
jgi:hypothetical protein